MCEGGIDAFRSQKHEKASVSTSYLLRYKYIVTLTFTRVDRGRPIIGIGVNIYINTVVKITVIGFHQQLKRELRFGAIKSELSLEGT